MAEPLTREQLLANPPFQPLPGSVPVAPVAQAFDPASAAAVAGEGIDPRLFGGPGARGPTGGTGAEPFDRIAQLNKNFESADKQQNSFLPNAIAIGAMLTGNFGPMMQLQEQKRKTVIGQLATPYLIEATQLSHQGKFDEANNVIAQASGQLGPRAPEVLEMFKPVIAKISKDQTDWRDTKSMSQYLDKSVPDTAHPDVVNFRDFARESIKNQTPVSASLLSSLYQKALPHMQMINDQAFQQGGLSGKVTGVPLSEVQNEKQLQGPGGMRVAANNQMNTADLTNVLRLQEGSKPIILGDGRMVSFGDPTYTKARNEWVGYGIPLDASLEVGKQIPYDPAIAIALQDVGATPDQIATRTPTPKHIDAAITADTARKAGIASAAEIAKIRQNPLLSEQSGLVNIDLSTGLPIRGGLAIADAEKRGVQFIRLPVATFENKYQPSVEALTGLANLEPFIAAIGDPKTLKERVISGGNRWLSNKVNVALAEGIEESKLFQKLINDAIEEATRRNGISQDDKDVRAIKELTTGIGTDPDGARTIVREIQKRLTTRLYQETGEAALARPAQALPAPAPGATPAAAQRQPDGSFQPEGQTTFTPGTKQTAAQRRAEANREANRRAAEILNPIIDQGTATPGATPTPAAPPPKSFVKPGTLR